MAKTIDSWKEVLERAKKTTSLDDIVNRLANTLDNGEKKDPEQLTYKFLNQPYFSWEESLIDKFAEIEPTITFEQIKNKGINLGALKLSNWESDFGKCLNNIKNNEIKKAFILEIFEKIQSEIWTTAPYDDFSTECDTSRFTSWTTSDVLLYFERVSNYLNERENSKWWIKTAKILRKITITNEDLNWKLPSWEQIPGWIPLKDDNIPTNTKESFDTLLSFEISKEIEDEINTANHISNEVTCLFSNCLPAINTIIGENEKYKYDESKLWPEYQEALKNINDNEDLSVDEKIKQINNLKREYYIKYLKNIEPKIGNTIEELFNNEFDYSKLDISTLSTYLDKVTDIRLKNLSKDINETLEANFGEKGMTKFSKFYKDLANPNIKEIHLNCRATPWTIDSTDINIPIEKNIIPGKNPSLMDIEKFWNKAESYDCLPFEYKIKIDDIENLNINEEDKKNLKSHLLLFEDEKNKGYYTIKWKDAWELINLFFITNSKISKTQTDSVKQEETEKLFWDDKKENEKKSEEEKQKETENFINQIEWRWNWNKFEDWAEIWLPMWNSELPWWWYQWMKIKINNVNKEKWTFTWRVFWWELKFSKDLEWKSKEFKMDENFIKNLENITEKASASKDKIWLLPNPNKSDFNSYKDKLNGNLWTWKISFPEWVKWNGQKFTHKITDKTWKEVEKEAKYFWVPWDDTVSYKIKYHPSNHSFKVSTAYNWTAKRNDWKSENVRYSYSRDMDWNNFLIFFTQKWLTPQTQKQSNDAVKKQEDQYKIINWWHRKLNWFSLNTFKNVFKTLKWNIKKKIDDYNKSQEEKLEDILIWDRWLYGKLANILWFIPSMKYWLGELEQEYYNERDNRTRKKIKVYYEKFCADYDLPDTFDQEPRYIKIKWKWSLKDQVLSRVANSTDQMKEPWIHQAAWLLLANIEKGWGPYRGLAGYENEWLWVKALLWNAHYENYLKHKKDCIDAFSKEENKDKLQDALANSEMTYIVNNILWKDSGLLFGAGLEKRWLPKDFDHTNYVENPAKRILSEQFAKKLDDLTKWLFNDEAVRNKIPKHNYFEKAENDFYRTIKTWRPAEAMGNLEWMISLARTDTQVYITKKSYLILMLSGILDFNWNKKLRKWAYTQWKTFWFAPAMLAKNIWHSEEIVSLLDDFSGWDFSKNVTAYCHKEDLLKWKTDIDNLIKQTNWWFDENKMKDFDNYVESIPWKNWENKSEVLKKLQKDLTDYNNENPDDLVIKNAKLISSAWLNASADAVSTRLRIENWEFKWNDQDEKADMGKFWESCAKKIKIAEKDLEWPNGAKLANQMLDKYLWRFWINWDNKQAVYKRINTACRYNKQINETWNINEKWKYCNISKDNVPTYNKRWEPITVSHVPLWKLYDSDIKKILRYWLEWFVRTHRLSSQQLPQQLKDTLDNFQDFFQTAFDKWYFNDIWNKIDSKENDIFNLWWWDVYETITQKNNNSSLNINDDNDTIDSDRTSINFNELETSKQKKNLLKNLFDGDNYKNSEMNNMRKSLKNHWVSLDDKEWWLFNETSKNAKEDQKYS